MLPAAIAVPTRALATTATINPGAEESNVIQITLSPTLINVETTMNRVAGPAWALSSSSEHSMLPLMLTSSTINATTAKNKTNKAQKKAAATMRTSN